MTIHPYDDLICEGPPVQDDLSHATTDLSDGPVAGPYDDEAAGEIARLERDLDDAGRIRFEETAILTRIAEDHRVARARLAAERDRLKQEIETLRRSIDDLRASRSWRITKPVRSGGLLLRGLRARLRPPGRPSS